MMMYVSSAYLQRLFSGVMEQRPAGCRSNGRPLNDAGRVRVAVEVLDQPVVYVIRDVHLGEFIKQCWV